VLQYSPALLVSFSLSDFLPRGYSITLLVSGKPPTFFGKSEQTDELTVGSDLTTGIVEVS